MSRWECSIDGCGAQFADAESAVIHQTTEHEQCECDVCGALVPEGYFAIRHVLEEHTRAEYVRAYGANADEIRTREEIKERIEDEIDLKAVIDRLDAIDR